jgi:SARP family transcriptional regulator, regulator of embCAB operon
MRVRILGEFDAVLNAKSVVPTATKPRQLFALLALHVGQIVSVPTLIDELWGERPPLSARTTLQTYVLRVRRHIEAALPSYECARAKEILSNRFDGYVLNVEPDDVDACGYERLVKLGNQAIRNGDHETGSRLLGVALEKWQGPPLAGVRTGMRLNIEVSRLEESRLTVLESRIGADIQLGRHRAVLGELTSLTAQHPMHENLFAYYMVALYRSGRQWQALEAFKVLRGNLDNELGVVPSDRLQQLHQAILRPELDPESSIPRQWQPPLPTEVNDPLVPVLPAEALAEIARHDELVNRHSRLIMSPAGDGRALWLK